MNSQIVHERDSINLLACVGFRDIAQLWDTQSYQPLGKPLSLEDNVLFRTVCHSLEMDGTWHIVETMRISLSGL